ncbi:MAG: aspartate aminotransferase family protein [Balneolales bacterium]|nr:aspartate aminotransferase family protein [Balneolales bacterium]
MQKKLTSNQDLHKSDKSHYLQTFRRYPLTLDYGKGARVWDIDGKEYIDLLAGIAVNNVGHAHPKVVQAIKDQAEKLLHISNFYLSRPQAELSQKLIEISGLDRVFITNSGAESVEGAIKVARKYGFKNGKGGTVISMENCFHGRTLATISAGKETMQTGFGPMPGGFVKVPFNNFQAIETAIKEAGENQVSAIILELIQGEGGINVADESYVKKVRQLCDEQNIVLIFDEIQSGIGRTGKWFAKDHYGVQPDIMTLAKGLGGGVPIGAILSNQKVSDTMDYGDHGTTFGGNPLVCATSMAVLSVIEDEHLLDAAREKGEWIRQRLEQIAHPGMKQIKGKGLMIGVEFDFETKPLVALLLDHGVLANATAGNILRLVPPLTITHEELEIAMQALEKALANMEATNA